MDDRYHLATVSMDRVWVTEDGSFHGWDTGHWWRQLEHNARPMITAEIIRRRAEAVCIHENHTLGEVSQSGHRAEAEAILWLQQCTNYSH